MQNNNMQNLTVKVGKKGKPLCVKVRQGYKSFYIFSAVSPLNGDNFSLFLPEINTQVMSLYFPTLTIFCYSKKLIA